MSNALGFQDTITKRGPVHLQEYHIPHFSTSMTCNSPHPLNGRKHLQIIYDIKNSYLEYVKNSYNLQTNLKMGKGAEQTFLQRYTNGRQAHEKLTSLIIMKMPTKHTHTHMHT